MQVPQRYPTYGRLLLSGHGSHHYRVTVSPAVLYVVSLFFVVQNLFTHPSVLPQEEFL